MDNRQENGWRRRESKTPARAGRTTNGARPPRSSDDLARNGRILRQLTAASCNTATSVLPFPSEPPTLARVSRELGIPKRLLLAMARADVFTAYRTSPRGPLRLHPEDVPAYREAVVG